MTAAEQFRADRDEFFCGLLELCGENQIVRAAITDVKAAIAANDVVEEKLSSSKDYTEADEGISSVFALTWFASNDVLAAIAKHAEDQASQAPYDGRVEINLEADCVTLGDKTVSLSNWLHDAWITLYSYVQELSIRAGWIDAQNQICLPESTVPPADGFDVDLGRRLYVHRRQVEFWRDAYARFRHIGGHLRLHDRTDTLPGWPSTTKFVAEYGSDFDSESLARVSQYRLRQNFIQRQLQFSQDRYQGPPPMGLDACAALLPISLLSFDELIAMNAVSDALHHDFARVPTKLNGLSIVEWLRGYACLKEMGRTRLFASGDAQAVADVKRSSIIDMLTRTGFSSACARYFIHHASCNTSEKRPHVRPLIAIGNERFLVSFVLLASLNIADSVLESIYLDASINTKGDYFELQFRSLLRSAGHTVREFKWKAEKVQVDAAFAWGDYAFFFECKNRRPPTFDATSCGRFLDDIDDDCEQILKISSKLAQRQDVLANKFPEAIGRTAIFAVVSCLPRAIPVGDNGVYFTDYISMWRFFNSPKFGGTFKSLDGSVVEDRVLLDAWAGKQRPEPPDLLAFLVNPIQYRICQAHLKNEWNHECIEEDCFLAVQRLRMADHSFRSQRLAITQGGG